jgi:hypothetical protein
MPRKKENLSPADRVKKSIKNLVDSGGKQLLLRLSPEGYAALKVIMEVQQIDTETKAINTTLIEAKATIDKQLKGIKKNDE